MRGSAALEREVWKPIPGFTSYAISTSGRLMLKPFWNDTRASGRGIRLDGKPRQKSDRLSKSTTDNVCLRKRGKNYWFRRSQLILMTFVGPRPSPQHVARHLDDNTKNTRLSNLAWGTARDNYYGAVRNGTHGPGTAGAKLRGFRLKGRSRPLTVREKISKTKRLYPQRQHYHSGPRGPDGRFK